MGAMNRPTAGARFEKALPRGKHPLQLHSLGTPNGQKVTILLEELVELDKSFDYDAFFVDIFALEQFGTEFVDANPNSKIPVLLDHSFAPPLRVFESCNILKHICESRGVFIPTEARARTECFNWLFWQASSAPYIGGGFGHFYRYAPLNVEYAIDRFTMETKRQLDVLDKQLEGKAFVCGDEYTIADMSIMPWILCLREFYGGGEFLELDSYRNVDAWVARLRERPAVQRGLRVNGIDDRFGGPPVKNRHSRADFD